MKRLILAAVALISSAAFAQFCPCYTLASSGNTLNCGVAAVKEGR